MPRRITLFFLFLVSYVLPCVILAIQLLDPQVINPGY